MRGRARGRKGKILLRAGVGRCGCGGLAVAECWAVTECELCTAHKWGAAGPLLSAGVIGGYGGVTEGLRVAFFGFAGGSVQYCGRAFFGFFRKSVQNLGTALF